MAQTALDIIKRALRMVGELAAETGEAPNAAQAEQALIALNGMLAEWEMEGVPLLLEPLTNTTTVTLPDSHLNALAWNLAVHLSAEYGRDAPPTVAALADRSFRTLQAAYANVPQAVVASEYVWGGRAFR